MATLAPSNQHNDAIRSSSIDLTENALTRNYDKLIINERLSAFKLANFQITLRLNALMWIIIPHSRLLRSLHLKYLKITKKFLVISLMSMMFAD
jgi:hypothetical protein